MTYLVRIVTIRTGFLKLSGGIVVGEEEVVAMGLTALARAGMVGNAYLGHFGLGLLSSYFTCEELGLSTDVIAAIKDCRLALIAQEPSVFLAPEKKEKANPELVDKIRDYLLANIGNLSRSGHLSMVGAFALKAFLAEPDTITPWRVDGIVKLFDAYTKERPEPRYYGSPFKYRDLPVENVPEYQSSIEAFDLSIAEMNNIYPDSEVDGVFYYFAGEKLHIVTHAHALWELEKIGEKEIAKRGYAAHRLQVMLGRATPPDVRPLVVISHLPLDCLEFWQLVPEFKHHLGIPHTLKRSFAFLRAKQIGLQNMNDKVLRDAAFLLEGW